MKNVYVILAFHAHELLWDLPETLLTYLDEKNPMKESFLDENYLKKRKKEGRDIYSLCSKLGDTLDAPMCVEYTNELLVQVKDVMPGSFANLKEDYGRGRLHPIYGHAHHAHNALLRPEEITQEIVWNRQYLHNCMQVPYPKYNGLFPPEDSLVYDKMEAIAKANIDYVIFPHLDENKTWFEMAGEGDYIYRPFIIRTARKNIIALPRNFPISQEIWRPITKMKRDEVKSQGYMLGDFPVFDNEYLHGEREEYPIDMDTGVGIYKEVLRRELERAPEGGLLLYVQDLELMDFGDIALEIMEKAWRQIIAESGDKYKVHFVTPDRYIDEVLAREGLDKLPEIKFNEISWAPEIRLVLRADGHYPPLGASGAGGYDTRKTGNYDHPLVFWENGKYYCGIFDTLLDNFGISTNIPANVEQLGETRYDLARQSLDSQAVLYLRLMKRACNWGWRPTEGRQKRPCLLGYLLAGILLDKLQQSPSYINLSRQYKEIASRNFVGLCETLKVFIDNRLNYLRYGLDQYAREKGKDLQAVYALFDPVEQWKEMALDRARQMFVVNRRGAAGLEDFLKLLREYSQGVYMATDYIQAIWSKSPDTEYLVDKMYHYLYKIYPPLFPAMLDKIDAMDEQDVEDYFLRREKPRGETTGVPFKLNRQGDQQELYMQ
ncbi:glycoside hydrolase [Desulfallas thermosapovorans]|uniref:Glycosyl hydrolase family 57 n=1 Tax=Desulfallas thermosapovorans DSM 6562 TaxID=1121431 RepID=A0A5S4ZVA3_9FIRM|nr:glycoside hydrolase [Desulfallas thermosapovorans]TYO96934.1 hypothetical protein LX24_00744 [Desulfallas thermosapovorans DSM 6562]